MDGMSWPILESHMNNLTFPTIHLLHGNAHGGLTTEELKEHALDSWLFHLKIDAGALFSILVQLTGSTKKAGAWWRDCEVEESPAQVWSWQK